MKLETQGRTVEIPLEVEEVSLQSEPAAAEGGSSAEVDHGRHVGTTGKAAVTGIDTAARQRLVLGLEVGGRDPEAPPPAVASNHTPGFA